MSFNQSKSIKAFMSAFHKPWFIAGGWAIDVFIGQETREHADIEIGMFRHDQMDLQHYLNQWRFEKVIKGTLHPWKQEFLQLPIHELHATNTLGGYKLEILLNEKENGLWKFRRCPEITRPLNAVWSTSHLGIPYLNPEIVLLYKAKNTRSKDHQDFLNVKDFLHQEQKAWLREAIQLHEPEHIWLKDLK